MKLYLNPSPGRPGVVNLGELRTVRAHHMPAHAVQFAHPDQLHRVAAEVTSQHPHFREEAEFVVADELSRRERLGTSMVAVWGGRHNG